MIGIARAWGLDRVWGQKLGNRKKNLHESVSSVKARAFFTTSSEPGKPPDICISKCLFTRVGGREEGRKVRRNERMAGRLSDYSS